jgi:hypothetical protein
MHATIQGRGKDKSPDTKIQAALAYAKAGGAGAGRKVARRYSLHPDAPKKYYTQCNSRDWQNKRAGNCGRKGLLERRPEVREQIIDLLNKDDEQSYRELGAGLQPPESLWAVRRACQQLSVELYISYKSPALTDKQLASRLEWFDELLTCEGPNGEDDELQEYRNKLCKWL